MARLSKGATDDRQRERRRERLRRLAPRPLARTERAAIALAAVLGALAIASAACVPVIIFWGGWDAVRREPLALGGIVFYGLPISALGAYWNMLRHRDRAAPHPVRCLGRALAGAGVGIAMAAGATMVFAGLVGLAALVLG